ncbi:DUF3108 domain-containing protein [Massilia litorea]|jgi:hypothetical protein|uniref:DUF3108 domain-containing protein n=1 Tax=Massilia litorea TaxID=2769491 RepID=A0A7L9U5Q1_9BURK|nr:DUF3108 domain-containing protein [Massilia litorea]QOL50334.1 DUF3108 domain-containing protein [Massilia litorea]
MGIVATIFRQRRAVLVGLLIVLLHAALFSFISGTVALPRLPAASSMEFVQAQVLPTPPAPPPAPLAPPLPKPLPPPPLPELAQDSAPVLNEDAVGPPVEPGNGGTGEAPVDSAAPAIAAAAPPPASPPAEAPAPPVPLVPEMRRYKVDVPPPATITMDVARVDADGTRWNGEAQLLWTIRDDTYHIEFEAGIRIVFTRVNLAVLTSEGALGATGFMPVKMTEKRRGRALTATHFDWSHDKISFSSSQKTIALAAGAQDKASVPLQLAAIARGDPAQLAGEIDIQVGEDRDAVMFRFVVVGQEEIDTKLGKLQTVHLSRPPKEGSYRSRLDVWLAPGKGWYPVQIRNTEANGAVTTQTVNNIALTDTGK